MQKIKTLIVDDETNGRKVLKGLLMEFCEDIDIIGEAGDVETAIDIINDKNPDLVFLDIELPKMSGFKLLEKIQNIQFEVIFTTAYPDYAKQAFRVNALHYLIKPVDIDELISAISRYRNINNHFTKKVKPIQELPSKTKLNLKNSFLICETKNISHIQAEGKKCRIFLQGEEYLVNNTFKTFKEEYNTLPFIQIHRSIIINIQYIRKFYRTPDYSIEMENKKILPIGRSYKKIVKELLE